MINEISRAEKDSIMYYQGGGTDVKLPAAGQNLREFYDAKNSYMVMNALLMPGAGNEKVRLMDEKKKFDPVMLEHMDELLEVYCRLYSAMCKYTRYYERESRRYTYRSDRMNTLEFLKHGQMYSFMSTQVENAVDPYFRDKAGILLLEIEASGDIEHVDVNAVLGEESKYPGEQEILYAPFLLLDKVPLDMTDQEKAYRDMNGEAPKGKYLLRLKLSSVAAQCIDANSAVLDELYGKITDIPSLSNAKRIWESFMREEEPEPEALDQYEEWKGKLQIYLRMRFAGIKWDIVNGKQNGADRLEYLKEDIAEYQKGVNQKRMLYERYVEWSGTAVTVLYPLAALAVALSYIDELEPALKALSLLITAIGTILPAVAKCLGWGKKLQQRTNTYLQLDELQLDLDYEENPDRETVNKYVNRFKEIVRADNRMGLENAGIPVKYLESISSETKN